LMKRYPERFSDEKTRDELVFQTARAIVIGEYVYIVLGDYLGCLTGVDRPIPLDPLKATQNPTTGNYSSYEFNFIYRWHPLITEADEKNVEARFIEAKGDIKALKHPLLPSQGQNFAPGQLETELTNSMKSPLGNFVPLNSPDLLKPAECESIIRSRKIGLCTFNDLRQHFGKPRFKSWSDFNSDRKIQVALSELYASPDDVELWPGCISEEPSKNNGVKVPYTFSRIILADAVNLIKNDRFLTDDLNPQVVTQWGYETIHSVHIKELVERNSTAKLDFLNGQPGKNIFNLIK